MRKVLSFVLVLSLVLGSFGMAFAAPLSDMAGQKSEEAVSVLTELGVVSGYPDGTYKPGNIVTRAEMAVIVVSALGLADYATGTSSFSDMAGHWSNGYVAYATSLGVIAGYPDGTFKPDKTVSYDEAATMLVAALGYNADSLVGTWPANFVTKAKTLGILDGIKAGVAGANRGDIAIMVYQTLDQQIGKTNKDGDFVASAGDTMLARLDAELYDPDKGAAPSTTDPGDAFVLDDTADVADGVNVRAFYGAYVTAYANSDNEIIAVKEVKSTFLTGEFAAAVVAGANILADADFEAEKDYALKSAIDTDDIISLVNGENNGTGKAVAAATEYKVAAKVSGVKITDIYSISDWDVTKGADFMFEDGDLEDDNIAGNMFALNDDDEIDLTAFDLVGVASLEDIDEDNVVYVYDNAAGDVAKIEVGTEVVKGEVTKISSTGSKVTVAGKAYELAAASGDGADFAALDIEDEVEFYLDFAGDVYEVEIVESEGENYAMILETEDYAGGLSSGNAMSVELFLADGTTKVFEVDKDYNDASTLTNGAGVWGAPAPEGPVAAPVLVEYGLDEDGVIDYIELVTLSAPTAATTELTTKGYYDGKIVASDAIMFTYDVTLGSGPDDEDCYGVTTLAKSKDKEFSAEYFVDSNKITVMVIAGLGSADEDIYGVVTSRAKTSASGTDYQVTMLIDGEEVVYDITSTEYAKFPATYDYFTVYKLTLNTNNEITKLTAAAGAEVVLGGWTKATAFSGGVVTVAGPADYTIDADAVAYALNDDGDAFEKSSVSKSNLVGNNIKLYDIDEDLVADIVLIQ